MVGVRFVAVVLGIVFVLTGATEVETDLRAKFSQLETQVKVLTQRLQQEEKLTQQFQQEEKKVSGLQIQMERLKKKLDNVTDLLSDSKNGRFEDIIARARHAA